VNLVLYNDQQSIGLDSSVGVRIVGLVRTAWNIAQSFSAAKRFLMNEVYFLHSENMNASFGVARRLRGLGEVDGGCDKLSFWSIEVV
jgi:hypothetical protein